MEVDEKTMMLIIGRLRNTNSVADDNALDQWLAQSAENQKQFEKLAEIWQNSEGLSSFPEINTELQWQRFKSKHFKSQKGRVISLRVWQYAAAAVLVAGLFLGGIFTFGYKIHQTDDNQRLQVKLSDGSEVILGENTRLKVPYTFNWWGRETELSGTAFFNVTKNPDQAFEISGPESTTRVLGTSFELKARHGINELQVLEGKVAYWLTTGDTLIVKAGEGAKADQQRLQKFPWNSNALGYMETGIFDFENTPLNEVLHQLQNYYVFNLKLKMNTVSPKCRFSGSFKQQPLPQILEELGLVMGMDYEFNNGTLTVNNLRCN